MSVEYFSIEQEPLATEVLKAIGDEFDSVGRWRLESVEESEDLHKFQLRYYLYQDSPKSNVGDFVVSFRAEKTYVSFHNYIPDKADDVISELKRIFETYGVSIEFEQD